MSERHDLEYIKGDSIEFYINVGSGIDGISDIVFAVKPNYKASNCAIKISYGTPTSDGTITMESPGRYHCFIYATTMTSDDIPPTNYVYEIKVTTLTFEEDEHNDLVSVVKVYTPVYGQFKLLPNVTTG